MYFCNCKAEFSASLLQHSVSRDPSEITLKFWKYAAQETFPIIINIETVALLNIFIETMILFFRWIIFDE